MSDVKKYTEKLLSKRILIVGGSSGIGYAVAEASLDFGAHVTISSSSPSRIRTAIASLQRSYPSANDRIQGFPCNLGTPELEDSIASLLTQTCGSNDSMLKLDHIIFTAGENSPFSPSPPPPSP